MFSLSLASLCSKLLDRKERALGYAQWLLGSKLYAMLQYLIAHAGGNATLCAISLPSAKSGVIARSRYRPTWRGTHRLPHSLERERAGTKPPEARAGNADGDDEVTPPPRGLPLPASQSAPCLASRCTRAHHAPPGKEQPSSARAAPHHRRSSASSGSASRADGSRARRRADARANARRVGDDRGEADCRGSLCRREARRRRGDASRWISATACRLRVSAAAPHRNGSSRPFRARRTQHRGPSAPPRRAPGPAMRRRRRRREAGGGEQKPGERERGEAARAVPLGRRP